MAEENEDHSPPDTRIEPQIDAAWEVLGAASRAKADSYIDEQIIVARAQAEVLKLQAHELKQELKLRHWSLRMRHTSDVMKVMFEVSVALVALVVITVIGATIWFAAHDNGAVIEAFKVPPDMAQKGLTGDVVASQLLDRLTDMQARTDSVRTPSSYASNFGNDIKVEIPETGISIAEAYRYLAGWLGHRMRVSGEIFHTPSGIVVTARTSDHPGARFEGSERDLDRLVDRPAEYVYGQTQPFRYGTYLLGRNRYAEADAVLGSLALNGPAAERPWAYANWMYIPFNADDMADALVRGQKAAALGPEIILAQINAATIEASAGHDEQVLKYARATKAAFAGNGRRQVVDYAAVIMADEADAAIAEERGDFQTAISLYEAIRNQPEFNGSYWTSDYMEAVDAAKMHDTVASRQYLHGHRDHDLFRLSNNGTGWNLINFDFPEFYLAAAADDWRAAGKDIEDAIGTPDGRSLQERISVHYQAWPLLALAEAKTGDLKSAFGRIARTSSDCYSCMRARAQIDIVAKNFEGAAWWYAHAVAQAPSVPFVYAEWGAMLLHAGDYEAAIEKFGLANLKGSHFADPLEMWGEALMQKNRSDLALAKFEEANKYAPHWGRLHLKWGEALVYTGNKDEAQKQFAMASTLDLSQADRAEIAKTVPAHGG